MSDRNSIDRSSQLRISSWLLGTVLLDSNRWKRHLPPAIHLSDHLAAIVAAGFPALELWEFHYSRADAEEQQRILRSPLPCTIYNTYTVFEPGKDTTPEAWKKHVDAIVATGAEAIKFNVGAEPDRCQSYLDGAATFADLLPKGVRMLCECHGGTVLETPEAARDAFSQWPKDRFEAIVHPLNRSGPPLSSWFEALGSRITHLHLQVRDEHHTCILAEEDASLVEETGHVLRSYGFNGTATVEFTAGVATPGETPAQLLEAAKKDFDFYSKLWSS